MFTTFFSLSLLFALIHTALAQSDLSINTPVLTQCQSAQITWTPDGNPPYDIYVVSADDLCGTALENLGNQTSNTMNWTVDIASGTQVVLYIEDSEENGAWSGTITVGGSNNTSCITSTSSTPVPSPTTSSISIRPTTVSSSAASSTSPAVGAAAGPTNAALSMRPLGAVTLLSSAVLAAVAFAL